MNLDSKYWYLHNHKLFKNLNGEEVESLCIQTKMIQGKKNELIYLPNDVPRIYILKKGSIKIVSVGDDGEEFTKDLIQEGDIFGEITLEDSANNENEYAQALSNHVVICSFQIKDFEKILLEKPELSLNYTKWVGLKLQKMSTRYKDLINKDVRTRLHIFLVNLAFANGKLEGATMRIKNVLTQRDISGIIGATRQTVATLIGKLESENLLQYGRKEIIIPEWEKFKSLQ